MLYNYCLSWYNPNMLSLILFLYDNFFVFVLLNVILSICVHKKFYKINGKKLFNIQITKFDLFVDHVILITFETVVQPF